MSDYIDPQKMISKKYSQSVIIEFGFWWSLLKCPVVHNPHLKTRGYHDIRRFVKI